VVDTLTEAMKKVIASPEHMAKLEELGIGPYYQDPDGYTAYWVDTENRMKPLLEKLKQ